MGKESWIRKEETCSVLWCRLGDPGLNIMADTRACLCEKWLSHCFCKCWTRVLSIKHPCLQQPSLNLSSSTASQAPILCKHSASTNRFLIGESRFQTYLGLSAPGAGDKTVEAHPAHLTQVLLRMLPHSQAQIRKPRGKNLHLGQTCILCAMEFFSVSLFLQMQCLEASVGCASGKRCSYQCRKVMWHEIQHSESSLLCIRHWTCHEPHTLQMGVSGIFSGLPPRSR